MAKASRRHVLRPGEQGMLRDFLRAWQEDPSAPSEGRVFVNRNRSSDAERILLPGDLLEVFAPSREGTRVTLVERRDDIVVIDKPSGVPAEPDEHGFGASAREQVEAMLKRRVHAASRLDLGVSGLMTLTLSARAARHVQAQREKGSLRRLYLALASPAPASEAGTWSAPIARRGQRQHAETRYRVPAKLQAGACLLQLQPVTGRLHQLRVHAAGANAPLLGDRRYGGKKRWTQEDGRVISFERIMLHSCLLGLQDLSGAPWELRAPCPADFVQQFAALGGTGSPDVHAFW